MVAVDYLQLVSIKSDITESLLRQNLILFQRCFNSQKRELRKNEVNKE